MKLPLINHPKTGQPDVMVSMIVVTTSIILLKFLLDGVTIHYGTTVINFGHIDSLTYTAVLGPVLGLHGWIETQASKAVEVKKETKDD